MKKTYLSLFAGALMFLPPVSFAEEEDISMPPPPPHEEHNQELHKKRAEDFANKLGLTEEQRLKAKEIRVKGREKMKPLMEKMKALHDEMEVVRKENMAEFEKILMPEQIEILKSMKPKHHKKRYSRH